MSFDSPADVAASIVIPYGGGDPLALKRQIACLKASVDHRTVEIIVAVNTRMTGPVRPNSQVESGVRWIDASHRAGPSYARNAGAREARGTYLLFCDADDEVATRWVPAMLEALDGGSAVVSGPLEYQLLNHPKNVWRTDASTELPSKMQHLPFAPSCNIGIRKSTFEDIGGWDESLLAGEDADLSWRLQYAGHRIAFSEEATVHYRLREAIRDTFRQSRSYGTGDRALLRKHIHNGAKTSADDWARFLLSLILSVVKSPATRRSRHKAAARIGYLFGWLRSGHNRD